jgi:hypothetical protein
MREVSMVDFDRKWVDGITRVDRIEALHALIGLTRLGERPTTVDRPLPLFSVLDNHPEGRVVPVEEMVDIPVVALMRDALRPRTLASAAS